MTQLGVSENRLVPLNPMVLLIIIPMKIGYFIGGIPHFQTYPAVLQLLTLYASAARVFLGPFFRSSDWSDSLTQVPRTCKHI